MPNPFSNRVGRNALMRDTAPVGSVMAPGGLTDTTYRGEAPTSLSSLLQLSGIVPGLGDLTGPIGDAMQLYSDPESRTAANIGLAALGMLPVIPSMYIMRKAAGPAENVSDLAKMYPRQKGIFAGTNALTADLAKLEQAKKMREAGENAADVWRKTGWGVGPDGKWRFEIPDKEALFSIENMPPTEFNILGDSVIARSGKGKDVMQHPKLWDAYPDLGQVDIVEGQGTDFLGTYSRPVGPDDQGSISLNLRKLPHGEINEKSVSLHELQHAIQNKEGFARGGNPGEFRFDRVVNPDYEKYQNALASDRDLVKYNKLSNSAEYENELAASNAIWMRDYEPRYKALQEQVKDRGDWAAIKPKLDELFAEFNDKVKPQFKVMEELDRLSENIKFKGLRLSPPEQYLSNDEAYRMLAGEAEARMTQARMNMTPRARSLRYPWEPEYFEKTTGVPLNNLIVR